jgi:serine/threonine-protein kinase RsbW
MGPPRLAVDRAPGRPGEGPEWVITLEIPSDLTMVEEAVELLARHCFEGAEPSPQARFRLRVTMGEALTNAIQFGNQGDRDRAVAIRADLYPDRLRLAVTDEGYGFDPGRVPDPRSDDSLESPSGRGLFLIRSFADRVEFNEKGNTIWITLPRW